MKFLDHFAQVETLGIQKYLSRFPYWMRDKKYIM